jgi:hypothetical protein
MKKSRYYIFATIGIVFAIIIAFACNKDNDNHTYPNNNSVATNASIIENDIDKIMYQEYQNYLKSHNEKGPGKWWRWLKAHAGVGPYLINGQLIHCGFNLPCGECPGICSSFKSDPLVPGSPFLSQKEYDDGIRLLQMAIYNDSTFGMTFIQPDLTWNDTFYVSQSFFIGTDASNLFNKDSVIILEGQYPISYSHSHNGSTVVAVKTVKN